MFHCLYNRYRFLPSGTVVSLTRGQSFAVICHHSLISGLDKLSNLITQIIVSDDLIGQFLLANQVAPERLFKIVIWYLIGGNESVPNQSIGQIRNFPI